MDVSEAVNTGSKVFVWGGASREKGRGLDEFTHTLKNIVNFFKKRFKNKIHSIRPIEHKL